MFVTEGFTGNIALKTAEGTAKQIGQYMRDAMTHSLMSRHRLPVRARRVRARCASKMDPGRVNGGVFLGLDGVVIKSHGGADAEGYAGAIEVGYDMVRQELLGKIRDMIAQASEAPRPPRRRSREPHALRTAHDRHRIPFLSCAASAPACRERVVTNDELATMVDTTDEWIVQRTGIKQRYIAGEGETTSTLGDPGRRGARSPARASTADDIDLIIVATSTPDYTFPAVATQVQAELGITHGAAFDLQAVCSGFVFAVTTADKFLVSGSHKRALVIGAETFSRILDWNDRTTCVLFGDGAGAVVLEARGERRRLDSPGVHRHPAALRRAPSRQALRRRRPLDAPRRSAICGWRARRCSGTPSAW